MSNAEADNSRASALRTAASSSTMAIRVGEEVMTDVLGQRPRGVDWPKGQHGVAHLHCASEIHSFGQAHELGNVADLQLRHHAPAMHLDGFLNRAEIGGDLLVQASADHVMEDLTLARRELRKFLFD